MPTYEYKCPNGHVFEKFFPSMNDKRYAVCPTCKKRAVRQISGGTGLVFKGSGSYETHYNKARAKIPATYANRDDKSHYPPPRPDTNNKSTAHQSLSCRKSAL